MTIYKIYGKAILPTTPQSEIVAALLLAERDYAARLVSKLTPEAYAAFMTSFAKHCEYEIHELLALAAALVDLEKPRYRKMLRKNIPN